MLLPEAFTGSNDLESYVTHFELLAELQKWRRTEGDPAREVDERPHYFALRLQKSAIEFYRTLPQATRENYDECVKAFREDYSEKPVVFRGRLACRVQQPGEKLADFPGDLKQLTLKAYPTESQDIRDHLFLRGFLEGINQSQVRLDLKKQIGDKVKKIETVLERALHLEAVTRIEEEEQTPKVAVIRRDETKDLVEAVTKLVNQLSVDCKQRENRHNQSRERSGSRERWGDDRRNRGQQKDRGFNDRRRFPTHGPSHRDRSFGREEPSRRNDRQSFKCKDCGQEGHLSRNCRNCFLCGSSQHLKKKETTKNCNVIRVCSTKTIKCLNAEIILHGNRCVGLIDSGSSISLLSLSTYENLGKPGLVQTYTKRVLTANNSAVNIIGRVTLLVQLQPRLPEVEQEFVITADEGIESLLGIDFLKTNKCVLKLHEKKLYSSHFKISIPLTTEKTQGVQVFAIAGQTTYIQSKNESLMKIR